VRKASCLARFATCVVLAVVSLGCDLDVEDQRVELRYDAGTDTLDALTVYRGVTAPGTSGEEIAKAVAAARRVLGGRREFMVLDWPFYWDLDNEEEHRDDPEVWTKVRAGISVVEAGAFVDERGALGGWQLLRIREVSKLVDAINATFSAWILEAQKSGEFGSETPVLDEESRKAWVEAARAGHRWFALEAGMVAVDFPMSPEAMARLFREFGKEILDNPKEGALSAGNVARLVRTLDLSGGHLRARFGEESGGCVRFDFHDPTTTYGPALLEALRKAKVALPTLTDVALPDPGGTAVRRIPGSPGGIPGDR